MTTSEQPRRCMTWACKGLRHIGRVALLTPALMGVFALVHVAFESWPTLSFLEAFAAANIALIMRYVLNAAYPTTAAPAPEKVKDET